MDGISQCHTEIRRLRGVVRDYRTEHAGALRAMGREYDRAREREQGADSDIRQAFCAGMVEAYKNALELLSGCGEGT